MLEEKTYKVSELKAIMKTDRLDTLKGKLKTIECEFVQEGKGNKCTITITKAPDRFKEFCIYELGIPPQTNFQKLKLFYYKYFFAPDFDTLPYNEMAKLLQRAGTPIARQTFSDWIKLLHEQNITCPDNDDCVCYSCGYKEKGGYFEYYANEISEAEYKKAWCVFYETLAKTNGNGKLAMLKMQDTVGGKAVKKPRMMLNGLQPKTARLIEILEHIEL